MLRARRAIPSPARKRAGERVAERVASTREFAEAARVVVYAATEDELPTVNLVERALAAGKPVLWPRVRGAGQIEVAAAAPRDLVPDAAGMAAPPPSAPAIALARSDLVIVPGVAFTRAGMRLGRGGGLYDRLLATSPATSIGVAFDIQLADELPVESHDRAVDLVVTPNGLWRRTE
jgi:5-formyltetrahydrofolate cyclo-ligase